MTTGEKIARCRKQKNLTQEQLAVEMGVSRQAVSRWEGDLAFPETDTLVKMSRFFGVSCDWLLNYDGQEPSASPSKDTDDERGQSGGKLVIDLKNLHFEYKSKAHIGNLPLVHVNIGFGRVAKGVFAFGIVSVGVVAFGAVSLGVLAFGALCLGLLALGALSAGVVALGGAALGCIALGGLAIGMYSLGGCAIGLFACGGYAHGTYFAFGDVAVGGIALGKTAADGSVLSVLQPQFAEMREQVYSKLEEIPKLWSLFTHWCKAFFNANC